MLFDHCIMCQQELANWNVSFVCVCVYFGIVSLHSIKLASWSTESNSGPMLRFWQLFIFPSAFCSRTTSLLFSFSPCLQDHKGFCHLHELSMKATNQNTWSITYAPSDMFSLSHFSNQGECTAVLYSRHRT